MAVTCQLEVIESGTHSERSLSYVDFAEIDTLSKAIGSMLNITKNKTSLPVAPNIKYLSFSTVDGLTLTMLHRAGEWRLSVISKRSEFAVCALDSETKVTELKNSLDRFLAEYSPVRTR